MRRYGEPELLVILPRPEPWAAFAYLNPYGEWGTPADAERLAVEHVAIAGLTARTRIRAYARALLVLDHWCLYDRP